MSVEQLTGGLDTIWVILTAAMILLMEGGFALLEAGFVRRKKRGQHNNEGFLSISHSVRWCFSCSDSALCTGKMYGDCWE